MCTILNKRRKNAIMYYSPTLCAISNYRIYQCSSCFKLLCGPQWQSMFVFAAVHDVLIRKTYRDVAVPEKCEYFKICFSCVLHVCVKFLQKCFDHGCWPVANIIRLPHFRVAKKWRFKKHVYFKNKRTCMCIQSRTLIPSQFTIKYFFNAILIITVFYHLIIQNILWFPIKI